MRTKTIVFTAKMRAAFMDQEVPEPQAGQVLVQSSVSLISTGTECICFRGEFDEGTNWSGWVKYPFYPGYSAVGQVARVGPGVVGLAEGDAVFTGGSHQQWNVVEAEDLIKLPAGVSHEDASWSALAVITQTAVRRAEHTMGDTAVVIGLGPLGQMVRNTCASSACGRFWRLTRSPGGWRSRPDMAPRRRSTAAPPTRVTSSPAKPKGGLPTWYTT